MIYLSNFCNAVKDCNCCNKQKGNESNEIKLNEDDIKNSIINNNINNKKNNKEDNNIIPDKTQQDKNTQNVKNKIITADYNNITYNNLNIYANDTTTNRENTENINNKNENKNDNINIDVSPYTKKDKNNNLNKIINNNNNKKKENESEIKSQYTKKDKNNNLNEIIINNNKKENENKINSQYTKKINEKKNTNVTNNIKPSKNSNDVKKTTKFDNKADDENQDKQLFNNADKSKEKKEKINIPNINNNIIIDNKNNNNIASKVLNTNKYTGNKSKNAKDIKLEEDNNEKTTNEHLHNFLTKIILVWFQMEKDYLTRKKDYSTIYGKLMDDTNFVKILNNNYNAGFLYEHASTINTSIKEANKDYSSVINEDQKNTVKDMQELDLKDKNAYGQITLWQLISKNFKTLSQKHLDLLLNSNRYKEIFGKNNYDVMLKENADHNSINKYNEVLSLLNILYKAAFDHKLTNQGSTHATDLLNLTTKSLELLMEKYAILGMSGFRLNNGKFFEPNIHQLKAKKLTVKDKVEISDKLDFSNINFSKVENLNQSICSLNDLYVPANKIKK